MKIVSMKVLCPIVLGTCFSALLFAAGNARCQQLHAQSQPVRAWQGTIDIPTYKLGAPDPNPPFPLVSRAPVYPYTMLDNLTSDRVPVTYRALYLENQYLRITILPQLGGHVYSVYDKVDHREVLYRDHVIKYGLVGPRGAWISGGMEFSFPFAHTTDTVSPVESTLRTNPDGSATAVIGAMDWVSNMHWEIAITLRPGTARLEEGVTLFNSTPRNHLYLFWTNTAVHATDDTQYIYPMRETIDDNPFAIVQSWPNWKGVDLSWYKNDRPALAIFGRDVQRNFFGVYYHDSNYGVVHVANFRQDPGKKMWTWGTARSGKIWDTILSDNDGSYNEIQSGRFYTQGYREFMNPRRVEQWTEYWYPVRGLNGGYVEATPQMAINAVYPAGGDVQVIVSPVATLANATLLIKNGAQTLKEFPGLRFTPLQPATFTVPTSDAAALRKHLVVEVRSAQGATLLHWSAAEPVDGNPDLVASAGKQLDTPLTITPQTPVERLYLQGVFLQKTGNISGAMKIYDGVLTRDPGYVPALLKEAWYFYGSASYSRALSFITRANARGQQDPAVSYAAGVLYRAQGRLSYAKDSLWTSIHYGSALAAGPALAPAFVQLGEIAMQEADYDQAVTLFTRAASYNPQDAFALADLAAAERLSGKLEEARNTSARAVAAMPLLPYALAENWLDTGAGSDMGWTKTLSSDPENYLAIASWYYGTANWKSVDAVLHAAQRNVPVAQLSPMVDYYLAASARRQGNTSLAQQLAQTAAAQSADGVFPNRLTDAAILESAIRHSPQDAHAKYALGNFLFAHGRYQEAAGLWQQALDQGMKSSVLLRNLAVYQWRIRQDLPAAAALYQRAIDLTPQEYRLYTALDQVEEQQGDFAARTRLFAAAPPSVLDMDSVRARRAVLALEQSQPDAALALMAHHTFKPAEGAVALHEMFVEAYMQKGKQALATHQPLLAAQDFRTAMEYPETLGTGEPAEPDFTRQHYWLGKALAAAGSTTDAQNAWKQAAAGNTVYSAMALKKLGQDAASNALLTRILARASSPDVTAADLFAAARAEQFQGNGEKAQAYRKQALVLDPLLWQARLNKEDGSK